MTPKLVTLDAAGTLVRVNWSPARLASRCIQRLTLPVDEDRESERFSQMLRSRWAEYMEVNLLRSEEAGDLFWRRLCDDWLAAMGQRESLREPLRRAVWDLLYGPNQDFFALYEDTLPAIDRLCAEGIPIVVISNWDYSLHRILKMLGIHARFDLVIASLEEGFEKPDPRIFRLALERFGAKPSEALHVGDDVGDDHDGARGAGMRSLLVDRSRKVCEPPFISSLTAITEAAAWTS